MKINDRLFGFLVERSEYISELDATLYEMIHEKSGAHLAFLDRADENKSFAISFTTLPEDDTGVFHILEHSVLCGSRKYPVKEPFVELLKGSLNTFLNAMTYEDRTVYPVASRNDRDFHNLVSVYLDAVLHPMALENECIFRQEGWHYEPKDGRLSYNGVVYNEMKGAYSSPDELGEQALSRALFPTTPYGRDSGGDPRAIPTLTYEGFCAAHKKYYHPSNAKIFLDGSVKLDEILALIDSELSEYDRGKATESIEAEPITDGGRTVVRYDAGEENSAKARLLLGTVHSDFADTLTNAAISLVISAISASNDSPLKKAVMDSGLCEDFVLSAHTSRQTSIVAEFINCNEEDIPTLEALYEKTVRSIAEGGIDRELLDATLNAVEFKLRERDFGTLPKGVAFALAAFGSWNYGERPAHGIISLDVIEPLRARIGSDYYEKLLLDFTVDCKHRAAVLMIPDEGAAERESKEEAARAAAAREKMTDGEYEAAVALAKRLAEWQSTDDSPENLDTLPTLTLADITSEVRTLAPHVRYLDGARILSCELDTGGITYMNMHFDASGLSGEELFFLSVLASAIVNLPTEKHSPIELHKLISARLGNMYHSVSVNADGGKATPIFSVIASALDGKRADMLELAEETLLHTVYTDTATVKSIMMQTRSAMEESMIASGSTVAMGRALAAVSTDGQMKEYLSGYECYKLLKKHTKDFDGEKISAILAALAEKIFTRGRLTVTYTGKPDEKFEADAVAIFPDEGCAENKASVAPSGIMSEGIVTPSKVAYAVIGAKLSGLDAKTLGHLRVARSALSYEYLWNEIRVKGGAYGTGFVVRKSGAAAFYSYRDPSPGRSLAVYRGAADYLRALADSGADLTKFIIGAIGEYDILTTPRLAGEQAVWDYLNGWSVEKDVELRRGMLETDGAALYKIAAVIDEICNTGAVSAVGGREKLGAIEPKLAMLTDM